MFAKIGLTGFELQFAQSTRRMIIDGAITELFLLDYSGYPHTILTEQPVYTSCNPIVSSFTKTKNMVDFHVQMLEVPNEKGKALLVKATLSSLKVSYIQQPVLRLITYLTEQVLPSLNPTNNPSTLK
jgi:hypothetical protein